MLQEKRNFIEVVGPISEIDLKPNAQKGTGREYISGTVTIKTEDKINGEIKPVEIPFNVFAFKDKNNGDPNPAYKSLMDVKENYVSIAACGNEQEATYVRVVTDKGGIRENSFYGRDGRLVETARPSATFFNIVDPTRYEKRARFETVIFITGIDDELDREGVPTGRLVVTGAVPGYNGTINKIKYIADGKDKIEHISTYWNKSDTVVVAGTIAYTTTIDKVERDMGFGDPIVETRTRTKRELVINSGSRTALEAEEAFDAKEIFDAIKERKAKLEELKNKATEKPAAPADYGF